MTVDVGAVEFQSDVAVDAAVVFRKSLFARVTIDKYLCVP
jgi:hypothetical protein